MKLQRQLGLALLIQGFGVVATFLVSVVVSRRFGPEGQGYFSTYRSWIDLISVLGLFGFSQALTFHINAGRISARRAAGLIVHYGLALAVLLLLLGAFGGDYLAQATALSLRDVWLMCACALAMVLHGLFRAVALSNSSPLLFNLITASPGLICLPLIFFLGIGNDFTILPQLLMWSFVCAALLASTEVGRTAGFGMREGGALGADCRILMKEGAWSFIPAITTTIVPALTFWMLARAAGSHTEAGYFGMSLLFLNAMVTALNMVAPVLYNHWSKKGNGAGAQAEYEKLALGCSLLGVLAIPVGWFALPPMISLVFGASFAPAGASALCFIGASFFWLHNRILPPMLMAQGHHQSVAYANIVRSVFIVLVILVLRPTSARDIALCWVTGEVCCFAYMAYCLKNIFICSYGRLIGLPSASHT